MTKRTRRDAGRNDVRSAVPVLRKKAGRPSKLTPELQEKLCRAIRAGNYVNLCCALVGISARTQQMWMKKAASMKSGPYVDFAMAVEQAKAISEAADLAAIQAAAAAGEWRAACWFLERRFAERWGLKQEVKIGPAPKVVVVKERK